MRSGRWVALAAVLVLLAATGAWWLLREPDDGTPRRAERQEYAAFTGPLQFPPLVERAPNEVRELYVFAARRPDVMNYVPCFCGCWRVGHESAYDCFIDEVHPDGRVEIDEMGFT